MNTGFLKSAIVHNSIKIDISPEKNGAELVRRQCYDGESFATGRGFISVTYMSILSLDI